MSTPPTYIDRFLHLTPEERRLRDHVHAQLGGVLSERDLDWMLEYCLSQPVVELRVRLDHVWLPYGSLLSRYPGQVPATRATARWSPGRSTPADPAS